MKRIVNNVSNNNHVKRVVADGTYDSKENFRYLFDNCIEAPIKVRKNSSDRLMGCCPRKIAVLKQMKNFEKWKDSVSYGYRLITETIFSSMKSIFGKT